MRLPLGSVVGTALLVLGMLVPLRAARAQEDSERSAEASEEPAAESPVGQPADVSSADEEASVRVGEAPAAGDTEEGGAEDLETAEPGAEASDGPRTMRSEDAEVYVTTESSSPAAAVLGTSTVVFGVVTAGFLGYFLDRTGQVDTCAAAEAFEESERGCVNRRLIEGQQEVGLGLFIGALGAFAVLATTWAIVAATDSGDDPEAATLGCAPGLTGVACAGQF